MTIKIANGFHIKGARIVPINPVPKTRPSNEALQATCNHPPLLLNAFAIMIIQFYLVNIARRAEDEVNNNLNHERETKRQNEPMI